MNSDFRAFLRNYGQTLSPVVMVGKNGYDESVAAHLDMALKAQELVKIRFLAHKEDAEALSRQLADKVGGELVTRVGFNTLVYRDGERHLMQTKYREQ
jgi:RNA-binding protein